jgi:hypothetical protein
MIMPVRHLVMIQPDVKRQTQQKKKYPSSSHHVCKNNKNWKTRLTDLN